MTALADLQAQGRLSQVCPACGVTEAAGAYCTACLRPMAEADWAPQKRSEAQIAASRVRTHSRSDRAAENAEPANPGTLGLLP